VGGYELVVAMGPQGRSTTRSASQTGIGRDGSMDRILAQASRPRSALESVSFAFLLSDFQSRVTPAGATSPGTGQLHCIVSGTSSSPEGRLSGRHRSEVGVPRGYRPGRRRDYPGKKHPGVVLVRPSVAVVDEPHSTRISGSVSWSHDDPESPTSPVWVERTCLSRRHRARRRRSDRRPCSSTPFGATNIEHYEPELVVHLRPLHRCAARTHLTEFIRRWLHA